MDGVVGQVRAGEQDEKDNAKAGSFTSVLALGPALPDTRSGARHTRGEVKSEGDAVHALGGTLGTIARLAGGAGLRFYCHDCLNYDRPAVGSHERSSYLRPDDRIALR